MLFFSCSYFWLRCWPAPLCPKLQFSPSLISRGVSKRRRHVDRSRSTKEPASSLRSIVGRLRDKGEARSLSLINSGRTARYQGAKMRYTARRDGESFCLSTCSPRAFVRIIIDIFVLAFLSFLIYGRGRSDTDAAPPSKMKFFDRLSTV